MNAIDQYQKDATKTVTYPNAGSNLVYPAIKLAGEAGETADKIGKFWRNSGIFPTKKTLDKGQIESILLEMGDVLWYLAALATELNCPLSFVAKLNLEKLAKRKENNTLKGEGDNR